MHEISHLPWMDRQLVSSVREICRVISDTMVNPIPGHKWGIKQRISSRSLPWECIVHSVLHLY